MKTILLSFVLLMSSNVFAYSFDSAAYYYQIGIREKAKQRLLVAHQALEKAINLNPQYTEAYLLNGQVLLEMRRTDKAKENFTKLHELQPDNKEAIKELLALYYSYRQYEKAIELAGLCIDCENAVRIIGMSQYQLENYAEAEKSLMIIITKNEADAEATYTLARCLLDMEEYKKAVPWYEKAINMTGAKNAWMYELGLLYYNNNDYKNAVASFEKAAANGYEQKNDFNENHGYASLYAGQYEKGEQLLLGILERKPNNTSLLRDMAEIFYQQKQYDKSLGYCQKLMELNANDGKALYQAGLCFQKKGQKDRGQQMCDKAIEMDPSLETLRKKKEILGGM